MNRRKIAVLACSAFIASGMLGVPQAPASIIDLTTAPGAGAWLDGAFFVQGDTEASTGTGVIDSFVRIKHNGTEAGYNTDGTPEFDTLTGTFTHAVQVKDVPTIDFGTVTYREFLLDINESLGGDTNFVSLDVLKIYIEDQGDLDSYDSVFSAPVYNLDAGQDNWIKLDADLETGSGSGDMFAFFPSALFGSDGEKYVYLYCEFGHNLQTHDGFEEWAHGVGGPIFPEPTAVCLLIVGILPVLARARRRRG